MPTSGLMTIGKIVDHSHPFVVRVPADTLPHTVFPGLGSGPQNVMLERCIGL
jgi:hypothetical protein